MGDKAPILLHIYPAGPPLFMFLFTIFKVSRLRNISCHSRYSRFVAINGSDWSNSPPLISHRAMALTYTQDLKLSDVLLSSHTTASHDEPQLSVNRGCTSSSPCTAELCILTWNPKCLLKTVEHFLSLRLKVIAHSHIGVVKQRGDDVQSSQSSLTMYTKDSGLKQ